MDQQKELYKILTLLDHMFLEVYLDQSTRPSLENLNKTPLILEVFIKISSVFIQSLQHRTSHSRKLLIIQEDVWEKKPTGLET